MNEESNTSIDYRWVAILVHPRYSFQKAGTYFLYYQENLERYHYINQDNSILAITELYPPHFNSWGMAHYVMHLGTGFGRTVFFATHNVGYSTGSSSSFVTDLNIAQKICEIWIQEGKERWIEKNELTKELETNKIQDENKLSSMQWPRMARSQ